MIEKQPGPLDTENNRELIDQKTREVEAILERRAPTSAPRTPAERLWDQIASESISMQTLRAVRDNIPALDEENKRDFRTIVEHSILVWDSGSKPFLDKLLKDLS